MREIKFRAWQPHASLHRQPGMYLVDDMVWHTATDEQPEKGEVFLTRKIGTSRSSEFFEDVQIMQYTGLKDKNGVEIYEGDIVRFDDGDLGEVIYHSETASFNVAILKDHSILRTLWKPSEVISNIYENPELLEAKQ